MFGFPSFKKEAPKQDAPEAGSAQESKSVLKDMTDQRPSNRPEDFPAARALAAEDPDLNTPETFEVIDKIEENPEEKADVGDVLSQRKINAEEEKERMAASPEDYMVQHSNTDDNNERV